MSTTAFPLAWPTGRPRTLPNRREHSRFGERSFAVCRDELLRELKRLGAKAIVLSTNIELRQDGLPYANRRQPEDTGVAVYFADRKGRRLCFSCDRWRKIEDNLIGIIKTIEAIRGIERWGTGDAIDAAFTGFQQLPPPSTCTIREAVEFLSRITGLSIAEVERDNRTAALKATKICHPDAGGTNELFRQLEKAKAALGL
jgi:hypothetical protein